MLSKPAGSPSGANIYYTLDGSDPRDPATNLPSASAFQYSGPINLLAGAQVKTRIHFNNPGTANDWSPLVDKTFVLDEPLPLRIVELMYNPPGSADDTEYFELLNFGNEPIELAGVQITEFSSGGFTFSSATLQPGERIVVVKNHAAFSAAYPHVTNVAAGTFSGSLANEGELVALRGPLGELLQSFTYGDSNVPGWPSSPDGDGYSLEYIGPLGAGENPLDVAPDDPFDDPVHWRASTILYGTPGTGGEVLQPESADFNGDGNIDGRDFLAWQRGFGSAPATSEDGDANHDGVVSGADLVVWQNQYGTAPQVSALTAPVADSQPSLASFWLPRQVNRAAAAKNELAQADSIGETELRDRALSKYSHLLFDVDDFDVDGLGADVLGGKGVRTILSSRRLFSVDRGDESSDRDPAFWPSV